MITKTDIKDFKDVDCTKARESLHNVAEAACHLRYDLNTLYQFLKSVEEIQHNIVSHYENG